MTLHTWLVRFAAVSLFALRLAAQEPAWLAKVDALVAERLAKPDAVGFSVGIAQRGEVLLGKGYGLADCELEVPATAATSFRIGSITKQFTAALVLRLVEAEKLTLDDAVDAFVPDFPLQDKRVTIRMLLNHSSGIPSYTDAGEAWQKTKALELSHQELLAFVAGKPFDFEPGTDSRYSNTGYYLLGMVLEKVHGKPYAQIVREELTGPLDLPHTRCDSNRDIIEDRAQGYAMQGTVRCNDDPLGTSQPGAAGALLSTAGELVRWSMALTAGKFVTAESFALMTTPLVLPNGRDTGYGFGLMNSEIAGQTAVSHGGGINGFNSMLLWLPAADLHVAVISNSERASSAKLANAIVRAVLGVPEFQAQDLAVPAELRERYAGEFKFAAIGLTLAITSHGEKLRGQGTGQRAFDLLWQGGLEFRASFDPEVKLVFDADGKEVTLYQGGGTIVGKKQ